MFILIGRHNYNLNIKTIRKVEWWKHRAWSWPPGPVASAPHAVTGLQDLSPQPHAVIFVALAGCPDQSVLFMLELEVWRSRCPQEGGSLEPTWLLPVTVSLPLRPLLASLESVILNFRVCCCCYGNEYLQFYTVPSQVTALGSGNWHDGIFRST